MKRDDYGPEYTFEELADMSMEDLIAARDRMRTKLSDAHAVKLKMVGEVLSLQNAAKA